MSNNTDKLLSNELAVKGRISAIVPAYNAEKYLARAVNSLLDTRYPDLEIIIVDDGSTDRTLDMANSLHECHSDTVKAYRHQNGVNAGVSASRNLGIINSTGEWIAFLDADDFVYSHRFNVAAKILGSDSTADGVYGFAEMIFENEEDASAWCSKNGNPFGLRNVSSQEDLLKYLLKSFTWPASAITCRRSLLCKTGLFPEKFSIAEDCHLWLRMATIGNIVEGDPHKPVSAYCRQEGSLYQWSIERKADYVKVLLDYHKWAARNCADREMLSVIRVAIDRYIVNACIAARKAGKRELAQKLVLMAFLSLPWRFWNKNLLAQVGSILVGK